MCGNVCYIDHLTYISRSSITKVQQSNLLDQRISYNTFLFRISCRHNVDKTFWALGGNPCRALCVAKAILAILERKHLFLGMSSLMLHHLQKLVPSVTALPTSLNHCAAKLLPVISNCYCSQFNYSPSKGPKNCSPLKYPLVEFCEAMFASS